MEVKTPVVAGKPLTLRLDVAPKPKMHVYSPRQKDYTPVSLTVEKSAAYTAKPAVFPEPEKYFFAALDETQLVYSKPFQITVPIVVRARGGAPIMVKGTLEYQACDDAICYRPVKVPVEWTLAR